MCDVFNQISLLFHKSLPVFSIFSVIINISEKEKDTSNEASFLFVGFPKFIFLKIAKHNHKALKLIYDSK